MPDKNGPMGRPDLKPCPRQFTVWPNVCDDGYQKISGTGSASEERYFGL